MGVHRRRGDEWIRVAGGVCKQAAACLHQGLLRLRERSCTEAFQGVPTARLSPAVLTPALKSLGASEKSTLLGWGSPAWESTMSLLTILGELGSNWQPPPQLGPWSFTSWGGDTENPHPGEKMTLPKCHICFFSLPSIPASQGTPGWSPTPGRAMVPGPRTCPTPAWPQHHFTLTLRAFSFSSKLIQDPGGSSQVTLHK